MLLVSIQRRWETRLRSGFKNGTAFHLRGESDVQLINFTLHACANSVLAWFSPASLGNSRRHGVYAALATRPGVYFTTLGFLCQLHIPTLTELPSHLYSIVSLRHAFSSRRTYDLELDLRDLRCSVGCPREG